MEEQILNSNILRRHARALLHTHTHKNTLLVDVIAQFQPVNFVVGLNNMAMNDITDRKSLIQSQGENS
ncbi:hypothetical protein Fmac_032095 [Flemingia macrophylla]|uniref:Uncharacterized protein n=1 Tax=Flemingia macrophylla TaxID=520843 RepID=A0ABD1L3X3_9FABA